MKNLIFSVFIFFEAAIYSPDVHQLIRWVGSNKISLYIKDKPTYLILPIEKTISFKNLKLFAAMTLDMNDPTTSSFFFEIPLCKGWKGVKCVFGFFGIAR